MNIRKRYIKPTIKVVEIDGDLMVLEGSGTTIGGGDIDSGDRDLNDSDFEE